MYVTFKSRKILFVDIKICCVCFFSENELLKHQLKKYVNAVQLLRRQGAKAQGETARPGANAGHPLLQLDSASSTLKWAVIADVAIFLTSTVVFTCDD